MTDTPRALGRTGLEVTPWGLQLTDPPHEATRAISDRPAGAVNWVDLPLTLNTEPWASARTRDGVRSPYVVAVRVAPSAWGREMIALCRDACARWEIETIDLLQLGTFDLERIKAGEPFRRMQQVRDEGLARRFGVVVESLEDARWMMEHTPISSMTVDGPLTDEAWSSLLEDAAEHELGVLATARAFDDRIDAAIRALESWPIAGIAWP